MLRVHVENQTGGVRLRLEGRLAGAWVQELVRCCQKVLTAADYKSLTIDLDAVSYVDEQGQLLLDTLHSCGATLVANGALSRYLVERIQARCLKLKHPQLTDEQLFPR